MTSPETQALIDRSRRLGARTAQRNEQRRQDAAAEAARRRQPHAVTEATSLPVGAMHVEAAAGLDWTEAAIDVVRQIAEQRPYLTIDDVRPHLPPTEHTKARGAVMSQAAARGYIAKDRPDGPEQRPAGAYVCLPSDSCNGSPRPLWKSLVYQS